MKIVNKLTENLELDEEKITILLKIHYMNNIKLLVPVNGKY